MYMDLCVMFARLRCFLRKQPRLAGVRWTMDNQSMALGLAVPFDQNPRCSILCTSRNYDIDNVYHAFLTTQESESPHNHD